MHEKAETTTTEAEVPNREELLATAHELLDDEPESFMLWTMDGGRALNVSGYADYEHHYAILYALLHKEAVGVTEEMAEGYLDVEDPEELASVPVALRLAELFGRTKIGVGAGEWTVWGEADEE